MSLVHKPIAAAVSDSWLMIRFTRPDDYVLRYTMSRDDAEALAKSIQLALNHESCAQRIADDETESQDGKEDRVNK
jgi:hypothetical protein